MTKTIRIGFLGLLVVGALTVGLVGSALAQEPFDEDGPRFRFFGHGDDGWQVFDSVADLLGLTPEGLFSELHAGQTLDEVAEAQGVDTETIQESLKDLRIDSIQQGVEDGSITQEQADRMLDRIENGPAAREDKTPEERLEDRKAAIQQAVDDGAISLEQADWMLEGIENGWDPCLRGPAGKGSGKHPGMGGPRPPGMDGPRGMGEDW